jgi:hypothetical protein
MAFAGLRKQQQPLAKETKMSLNKSMYVANIKKKSKSVQQDPVELEENRKRSRDEEDSPDEEEEDEGMK